MNHTISENHWSLVRYKSYTSFSFIKYQENHEMNNEISFDSEKFSISKLEKTRPQETIDNLNDFAPDDADESTLDDKHFQQTGVSLYICVILHS